MTILVCILCFILGACAPLIAFWMMRVRKQLDDEQRLSEMVDKLSEEEIKRLKNIEMQWDNFMAYNGDKQRNSLD